MEKFVKEKETDLLVSVVIAFLNEERFLTEAIESVLKQDYSNWELILVDDGSNDSSTLIAKQFTASYVDKIRYYEHQDHKNKGLSASRNLGIMNSSGELVAFIDADDVWLPQKLSKQVAIFKEHANIAMVIEGSVYWNSWLDRNKFNFEIPIGAKVTDIKGWMQWATTVGENAKVPSSIKLDSIYEGKNIIPQLYPFGKGAAPCPCSWIVKKEVWSKVGGFEESFTNQYQLYEDQAFLFKVYLNERVFISSACNNLYRQRPESIVKSVKAKGLYQNVREHFVKWANSYIKHFGINDENLNKTLKKALVPYQYPIFYYVFYKLPDYAVKAFRKMNSIASGLLIEKKLIQKV